MQIITSKENALVKHISKLKDKKYRAEFNEYLIEGIKLVKEAITEKVKIKQIVISENNLEFDGMQDFLKNDVNDIEYIIVSEKVFNMISDVEKPQGVLAVISKNDNNLNIDYSQDFILILDNIQDPGNLGTIIRTADSCNIKQILVSKGTADSYNPKVIRSTMGAIFRVKIIECDNLNNTVKEIQNNNFKVVATSLDTDKSIYDLELKKVALVIGNEANGVSKEILNIVDEKAKIPMLGKTESLNASIATGVILYEYVRQKLLKK